MIINLVHQNGQVEQKSSQIKNGQITVKRSTLSEEKENNL